MFCVHHNAPSASTRGASPGFFVARHLRPHSDASAVPGKGDPAGFLGHLVRSMQERNAGLRRPVRRYKDRGLAVVGIALDSSPARVRRFAQKYGITYPLLINGMD